MIAFSDVSSVHFTETKHNFMSQLKKQVLRQNPKKVLSSLLAMAPRAMGLPLAWGAIAKRTLVQPILVLPKRFFSLEVKN